ncbi:MAG: shikimate kinase [Ignavibacteria bacterium]|nr:shikimate kinase [Ignavibacteria bacterium]
MKKKLFAVCGNPILHSKSPQLFSDAYQNAGIDAVYTRLAVDSAEQAIELAKEISLNGMNITAPFKSDIINFIDNIDIHSKEIGAVNTVVLDDNQYSGFNTDYLAITNSMTLLSPHINGLKCLVIGAGNAAKAAAYALKMLHCNVTITNRTNERAEILANKFNVNFVSIEEAQSKINDFDAVISTLPYCIDIDNSFKIKEGKIFIEACYVIPTDLLNERTRKFLYFSGLDWLKEQAIPAFELMTGIKADSSFMKEFVDYDSNMSFLRMQESPKLLQKEIPTFAGMTDFKSTTNHSICERNDNIVLIGFMGAGKTWTGRELSSMLDYRFIDTDELIEQSEGCPVLDIFQNKGEAYFRELETNIINSLLCTTGAVISCGGGAVLNPKNIINLKKLGIVIWLFANFRECLNRIPPDTRPILNSSEDISKIFKTRIPIYCSASDLIVPSGLDENPVNKIYNEYILWRKLSAQ